MYIASHQSNPFPWIGYFIKMIHSDIFTIEYNDYANLRDYTTRVMLNDKIWLTFPSIKWNGLKTYSEVKYNSDRLNEVINKVAGFYRNYKLSVESRNRLNEVLDWISSNFPSDNVAQFNYQSILFLYNKFNIQSEIKSQFTVYKENEATDLRVMRGLDEIDCKRQHTYLTGPSFVDYRTDKFDRDYKFITVSCDNPIYKTSLLNIYILYTELTSIQDIINHFNIEVNISDKL